MADARRALTESLDQAPHPTPDHSLFLVALSGGPDSLALAWAAAFVLPRQGHRVEAVIIDHGLQPESNDVAETAKQTAAHLGLDATVIPLELTDQANLESVARQARYDALEALAVEQGAHGVLLGHTLDDQAETVLLGLTRGSGPASIQGMPRYSGLWWRPFLGLRRTTTRQVCEDSGVSWWDDPHNTDRRFLRPRIRHDVMPVLEEHLGPGVAEALARTGELVGQDREELDSQASTLAGSLGDGVELGIIPRGFLAQTPRAIASRVVRMVARESIGSSLSHHHTQHVLALLNGQLQSKSVEIPGGRVERQGDEYRFVPASSRYRREEGN